jgi:beta-phosphoglucomutase
MIKGYIFDLDGVITDTAEFHYRSWVRLAEEIGVPFTRQDNEALRGVPRRASLEILLKGKPYPEAQMLDMMERKNNYYREFLSEIQPSDLLAGVYTFLYEAKAAGIKLGLGSASKNARDVCEKLGILSLLDVLGDGTSVVNQKPAPDLFIWVAGGMGFNPSECIVFEDAEAGVKAALDGGFWTVGLGPAERVGRAHRVRANLDAATVAEFATIGG